MSPQWPISWLIGTWRNHTWILKLSLQSSSAAPKSNYSVVFVRSTMCGIDSAIYHRWKGSLQTLRPMFIVHTYVQGLCVTIVARRLLRNNDGEWRETGPFEFIYCRSCGVLLLDLKYGCLICLRARVVYWSALGSGIVWKVIVYYACFIVVAKVCFTKSASILASSYLSWRSP